MRTETISKMTGILCNDWNSMTDSKGRTENYLRRWLSPSWATHQWIIVIPYFRKPENLISHREEKTKPLCIVKPWCQKYIIHVKYNSLLLLGTIIKIKIFGVKAGCNLKANLFELCIQRKIFTIYHYLLF